MLRWQHCLMCTLNSAIGNLNLILQTEISNPMEKLKFVKRDRLQNYVKDWRFRSW